MTGAVPDGRGIPMTRRLLYATSNPGKVFEVRKILAAHGLDLLAPQDLGLALDVDETGTTLEENAALKARAYLDLVREQARGDTLIVLADDTGLEIDALGGEPGIHIRRWIGRPMTDAEILSYTLERLADVPPGERGAQFRTVIAVGTPAGEVELFEGTLRGEILTQPAPLRIPGFPFEALFFIPEWSRLLGEVYELPPAEKVSFLTHRERAIRAALPRLRALLGGPETAF